MDSSINSLYRLLSAFIVCGFIGCTLAYPQACDTVNGTLYDELTKQRLPYAAIYHTKNNHSTTTDSLGNFRLKGMVGDTIRIRYIGYEERIIAVDQCILNVALSNGALNIQEVVIESERIIAEEFKFNKISKIEIYKNPSSKADPILAVNALPSATTLDESANISLRGDSPEETGIFLNNVPIHDAVRYSRLNGIGTFSIFNTSIVNRVYVYPSNPPLEYGGSTSGLISLQTDEMIPSRNQYSASLTLANISLNTLVKTNKTSSLSIFSNAQFSNLFTKLNAKSVKNLKAFSMIDNGVHFYKKLGQNSNLKIFNYAFSESYQYNFNHPTYSGIFFQHKKGNYTIANFRRRFSKSELSINQGASFSTAEYNYSTMNIERNSKDFYTAINLHHVDSLLEWKVGLSFDSKDASFNGSSPLYTFAYGEGYPTVTGIHTKDNARVQETYLYIKRYLTSSLILGAGIRKSFLLKSIKDYTSLQINLNYKLFDSWNLIFSYGKYYKYVLPTEEYKNPYLLSSNQCSMDASYKNTKIEVSTALFYKRKYSSIQTNITGIELFTRYKWNRHLRTQTSFTSLQATDYISKQKRPSPYNVHYFVRGNAEYNFGEAWTFSLVYLFRQGAYYHPLQNTFYHSELNVYEPLYSENPNRLSDYKTIDGSISKNVLIGKNISAITFLSVGNIFNFKNIRGYSYNADYSSKTAELFSQRVIIFGTVVNF